jgi:hypothetical protein
MAISPQIRLGGTLVMRIDRRFSFRNLHDPTQPAEIEDADLADLIVFLHESNPTSCHKIDVTLKQPGARP